VTVHSLRCRGRCIGRAGVKDLESEVVGNSADQGGMEGMMLDVIYNRCMVGVGPCSIEGFIARGEFCYVPGRSANKWDRR